MGSVRKIVTAALAALVFAAPAFADTLDDQRLAAFGAQDAPAFSSPSSAAPAAEEPALKQEDCATQPFGQSIFDGAAAKSPARIMSPKQRVAPGDRVSVAIWGAVQEDQVETVDSQGFIYIKGVGPVMVAGKTEDALSDDIRRQIGRVFKGDVQVYARLEQNAGTPVMVTGGVGRPGQYFGGAQDSLVVYLQRAGGILPGQGSYRDIRVLREGKLLHVADLYAFLQDGILETSPWEAGDVIVVDKPGAQVAVEGDVRRCASFELAPRATGSELEAMAQPRPGVSHVMVRGYRGDKPMTQVLSLAAFAGFTLADGDRVRFYSAPQNQQITVTVEGPTLGNRILALPAHTMLSEALDHIPVDEKISDTNSIFIKRKSVADLQQQALDESTRRLLQSALTAPASSDGEAMIRANEAKLVEEFVARIHDVKTEGRVVVMQGGSLRDLPLEDGDVIVVPQKTNIVSIEGEIVLPRAVVVKDGARVEDYVMMAGGYTERAQKNDFIVVRPNGDAVRDKNPKIQAGDRVLILPRVDAKNMQTAKDLVQILYQVAVGAGVLLKL